MAPKLAPPRTDAPGKKRRPLEERIKEQEQKLADLRRAEAAQVLKDTPAGKAVGALSRAASVLRHGEFDFGDDVDTVISGLEAIITHLKENA